MNLIPSNKSFIKYVYLVTIQFYIETLFYLLLLDTYHLAVRYKDS